MTVDDAIKAAEQAAEKLRDALGVLEHEARAELGELPHGIARLGERVGRLEFGSARSAVAMARRPKGATVMLEWSRGGEESAAREVVRRTATQVMVLHPDLLFTESYELKSGYPVKRGGDAFLGCWRIRDTDLAAIRAMPVGENAVSRALKAIEKGAHR